LATGGQQPASAIYRQIREFEFRAVWRLRFEVNPDFSQPTLRTAVAGWAEYKGEIGIGIGGAGIHDFATLGICRL
jgi:hypothetical protein